MRVCNLQPASGCDALSDAAGAPRRGFANRGNGTAGGSFFYLRPRSNSSLASGFASLTRTGRQLLGTYEETMTLFGLATSGAANEKSYAMKGAFALNRISDIATLETE